MKAAVLAAALAACGAPHTAPAPPPAPPTAAAPAAPDPHAASLDALMQQAVTNGKLVGVSVAVVHDGRPVLEKSYGFADAARTRPLTLDDELAIGSLTKQFTAAAVMTLVEAGKVKLDEPVATYVPAITASVTVRELLEQTTGLPDFAIGDNVGKSHDALLAWIAAAAPAFTPGSKHQYSNTNYWLAARVVEAASGAAFGDYLRDHVLARAGLTATHLCAAPAHVEPTTLRSGEAVAGAPFDYGFYDGAGALCSTIADLLRWQAALFGGKVVDASSFAFMTTPPTLSPEPSKYAAGLVADHLGTHRLIWHNGAVPGGFESALYVLPDDHLVVAVLTNTTRGQPGTSDQLALGLAGAMLSPVPRDLPVDAALSARIAGAYEAGGVVMTLRAEAGGVVMKAPAGEGRLLYQGDDRFVLPWNPSIEVRVVGDTLEIWQVDTKALTLPRAATP